MDDDILMVGDDPGTTLAPAAILAGLGKFSLAVGDEDKLRAAHESISHLILLDQETTSTREPASPAAAQFAGLAYHSTGAGHVQELE